MQDFGNLLTAMVTPFDEGLEVDYDRAAELVAKLLSEGSDGSYADILLDPDPGVCLVLIDFRRYSRHFRQLAEEAAARKIPSAR